MGTTKVGVQLHPQHTSMDDLRAAWRAADELGVDSIWLWDHFFPLFGPADGEHFEAYTTLAAINPRLIYGQITAYGPDDPRPGFDAILQAESGFTFLNGEPDGPPTKMPVAFEEWYGQARAVPR